MRRARNVLREQDLFDVCLRGTFTVGKSFYHYETTFTRDNNPVINYWWQSASFSPDSFEPKQVASGRVFLEVL